MKTVILFLILSLLAFGGESLPHALVDPDNATGATDISGRIAGGASAQITARNFQVAVNACGYICGGSLIRNNAIVTAAHCTDGCPVDQITVRAGSATFASGGTLLRGRVLHQHPSYNQVTRDSDISVLQLNATFTINNQAVGLVNLAQIMPLDNSALIISGYGTTSVGGTVPAALRSGALQLTNYEACNLQYRGTLNKNMFCAHSATQRACEGDEGGPITFGSELLGVISFGSDCAMSKIPGVFTSIPAFANWINQVLA